MRSSLRRSMMTILPVLFAALAMATIYHIFASPVPAVPTFAPVSQVLAFSNAASQDESAGVDPSQMPSLDARESRLLELMNESRVERGLQPLELDPSLIRMARERSGDMAQRGYFAHVTPEGATVFQMLDGSGFTYRLAGENLARNNASGDNTAEMAHNGFLNSPAHAANEFEPSYNHVGIGEAVSPNGFTYFTELFADVE